MISCSRSLRVRRCRGLRLLCGDAESVQLLDAEEEDETAGGCPEVDDQDAEALCAEKAPAVAVEDSFCGGEHAVEHQ